MIGKRLINTGAAADAVFTPSEHFNTVLYTGNGSTQRIGGYINRGAEFNGSSSTIDTGYRPATGSGEFSVSCFVLQSASSADGIWSTYTNTGTDRQGIGLVVNSSGIVKVNAFDAQGEVTISSNNPSTINEDTWYHMVVTYNAGLIKFYIDSVEQSATMNQSITAHYAGIHIGNYYASSNTSNMWEGKIDQFRIFDKALSQSEIDTLYGETHASTTISTTDIFDDDSGVALYQLDGNANDTGGVNGKFGSAAIFTGGNSSTGSKISISNDVYGSSTSVFSVSMWVNSNTNSGEIPLIGNGGTIGGTTGYAVYLNNGQLSLTFRTNPNQNFYFTNTSLYQQGWKHIVLTVNDGAYVLYLDGTSVLNGTTSNWSSNPTPTYDTFIGNRWNRNESGVLDGIVDEIRIYSDILTSTEVGYLYNNTTASIPTDNLQAYYKLNGDARDEQQLYDGAARNVTYAYDGTATNVTYQEATNFSPDLVWVKSRSFVENHAIFDSVRGVQEEINSNRTNAESTKTNALSSFNSSGFTTGANNALNANNEDYAAWCFNAGEGASATNNDGTIASTVKANQDAGFSIVTYTGTGLAVNNTIGHGLSSAPEMIILKRLNSTNPWIVYHTAMGTGDHMELNSTGGGSGTGSLFGYPADVGVAPTSTVFTVGVSSSSNASSSPFIAYNFHSVDNYQKVGSYTGNGGVNHIETDFEPAWIMIKPTSVADNWLIYDNKRGKDIALFANLSNGDTTYSGRLNFASDGFVIDSSNDGWNGNNETYIYLAIAADPDTTTPTVENSFDVVTWTGTASARTINYDFKPDLWIVKNRNTQYGHWWIWQDSVRGNRSLLYSNSTNAAGQWAGDYIDFIEDGIEITYTGTNTNAINENAFTYVGYAFKAGDHDDNLPQINTEGSIDSVVSVNAEAGFSIVKYTGTGSNASFGHGLSSLPELVIVKRTSATEDWFVLYDTTNTPPNYMKLNTSSAGGTSSGVFPSPATSTVVSVGNDTSTNSSGSTYIAYCFHSVTGYQKIGSYTGTGSAGNSVTIGFRPRFVMVKKSSGTGNWVIKDSQRDSTNPNSANLYPNLSNAENTVTTLDMDFDNNGFTLDGTSGDINGSSATYIYLAIK
jgi:hypothetical protein